MQKAAVVDAAKGSNLFRNPDWEYIFYVFTVRTSGAQPRSTEEIKSSCSGYTFGTAAFCFSYLLIPGIGYEFAAAAPLEVLECVELSDHFPIAGIYGVMVAFNADIAFVSAVVQY